MPLRRARVCRSALSASAHRWHKPAHGRAGRRATALAERQMLCGDNAFDLILGVNRLATNVSVEQTCSRHRVRCEWHWGEPDQILSFGADV